MNRLLASSFFLATLIALPHTSFAAPAKKPSKLVLCVDNRSGALTIVAKCSRRQTKLDVEALSQILALKISNDGSATGPKGDVGPEGPQGAVGAKGDKGEPGLKGEPGVAGPKGDKGDTGAKGDTGPSGTMGAKGQDGQQGEKGDPGIFVGSIIGTVSGCPNLDRTIFTVSLAGVSSVARVASDGTFRLSNVPIGTYSLQLSQFDNILGALSNVTVTTGTTISVGALTLSDCN